MKERLKNLVETLTYYDLDGLVLTPGPSLKYFTGLEFHMMERPTVFLVTADGQAAMILPDLERGKLSGPLFNLTAFSFGDDPATWQGVFEQAGAHLHIKQGQMGVEPTRLRFLESSFLARAFPDVDFVDGQPAIAALRVRKDQAELKKMHQAARIAQKALLATLKNLQVGMTEKAIANDLIIQLLRAGSDPQIPFPPVVAIGANSANPHAVPGNRPLRQGDLLLIDWGAGFEGYFSDITRTFSYGNLAPELKRVGEIVLAANRAGREAGAPGVKAGLVDRAARRVIADAGYAEAFIHRTGHGLGMEAHEPPYIYEGNSQLLETGMTFTIEPGIYLQGKGGIRIEDDVVVTQTGLVSLTDLPREVLPLERFIARKET